MVMHDGFPEYTSRESRTRPAGLGRLFCVLSVLCYGLAGLLDLSILGSSAFAADFDGGTRSADAGGITHLATALLVAGAVMAVAAIIRGGGHAVRAVGVLLLAVAGATAYITLPLLAYYG
ncbi:hypothetical protein CIW52_23475 [Mycolicibacterium sp. P9-64]|nr:hypothetical protein CIW52_23475 [Mycolicibacterium sp. P9-64]